MCLIAILLRSLETHIGPGRRAQGFKLGEALREKVMRVGEIQSPFYTPLSRTLFIQLLISSVSVNLFIN